MTPHDQALRRSHHHGYSAFLHLPHSLHFPKEISFTVWRRSQSLSSKEGIDQGPGSDIARFFIDLRIVPQMEKSSRPALHIRPPHPCPEDINTPTNMDNSVCADIEVAQVKFFPPLHEQRRSWALENLRRERVTSVGPSRSQPGLD